ANSEQDFDSLANKFTTIHVHGPILGIQAPQKNCDDNYNYTYSFYQKINVDYSSPNQYVDWYLRSLTSSIPTHIAHNKDTIHIDFSEPDKGRGNYLIYAVAYNGDEDCHSDSLCKCSDTVFVQTRITDIKADFIIPNPTPCLGDSTFIQLGPQAQDVDWRKTYWVTSSEKHGLDTAFHFDNMNITHIKVITADEFDCPDTTLIPVKVYKPQADFAATIISDCLPFETEFSDLSLSDTTIVSRLWDFGNNDIVPGNDSVRQTQYEDEGFTSPSLIVCDILGCCDTIVKQDYIKPVVPNSKFTVATPKLCLNHDAIFTRDLSNPHYDNNITRFLWDFGDGNTVSGDPANPNPAYLDDTVRHTYTQESSPNTFDVSFTAYSTSPEGNECVDTTTATIEVKDVSAQIKIRDMDKCKQPGQVFIVYIENPWYSGKYKSAEWYKIDNNNKTLVSNASTPRAITFLNYGTQSIELITRSDYYGCEHDTVKQDIVVPGYEVDFEMDKSLVCVGEDITFTRTKAINVDAYTSYWSFGDGVQNYTDLQQVVHAYSTLPDTDNDRFKVQYVVDAPNCKPQDIFHYVELHPVEANFLRGNSDLDSVGCAPRTVEFINTSIGAKNNTFRWDFGDGTTSTEKNPTHTFEGRNKPYEVSLAIEGVACNDETMKRIYFYPKPDVLFDYDSVLCVGESTAIQAQGTFNAIAWKPAQYFSNPNAATTYYTPLQSGMAYADVTSTYGCLEHDSVYVFVQQRPRYQGAPDSALLYYRTPTEIVLASRPDSKLIAGQIYNVNNTPIEGVVYEWSPGMYLSCTDCVSPDIHLECGTPGYMSCLDFPYDIRYSIHMYDTLGCFEEDAEIQFLIVIETKAALPQAFTPNGDGNNDIAFVRGWGIKEFLEVKIFNRWGQVVFESNDLQNGWDGRYKGEDQPMETYSYTLRYIDSKNEEQSAKGYITLIR
ncbi:MAG: gliding motility-associated C-terminal domain-containing protein, partial [Bacteroidales bacterium]|nr:gliding motility-associated C-terminal domain-containing protein [Bacteroidales bacterium]